MFLRWDVKPVIDEAAVAKVVLWLAGFCKDRRTRDTAYSQAGSKREQASGRSVLASALLAPVTLSV